MIKSIPHLKWRQSRVRRTAQYAILDDGFYAVHELAVGWKLTWFPDVWAEDEPNHTPLGIHTSEEEAKAAAKTHVGDDG
jgi:hypothetical protein